MDIRANGSLKKEASAGSSQGDRKFLEARMFPSAERWLIIDPCPEAHAISVCRLVSGRERGGDFGSATRDISAAGQAIGSLTCSFVHGKVPILDTESE